MLIITSYNRVSHVAGAHSLAEDGSLRFIKAWRRILQKERWFCSNWGILLYNSRSKGDVPAKKLVRHLDFTSFYGGACAPALSSASPELPLQTAPRATIVVKPKSPRAWRPRPVFDLKEGTPKKSKQCNCKNSRCLKLYCECFASRTYCDGCNYVNCCNNVENDAVKQEAVEATLERNPNC